MQVEVVQLAADVDPAVNRRDVDARLSTVASGTDLVVLPEATQSDFGPADRDLREAAEPLDGPFVDLLLRQARRIGGTVIGGMFEARDGARDGALPYNTLVVAGPDHTLAAYRKIHLYDSFGYRESDRLSAGHVVEPVTAQVADRIVGLMTCYDLRFPELARGLIDAESDLLVVPAAWVAGEHKLHHWRTLLTARAIENVVPVVAAAQGGRRYTGHSMIIDPWGRVLAEAGEDDESIRAELDPSATARAREQNPSLDNRRLPGFVPQVGGAP